MPAISPAYHSEVELKSLVGKVISGFIFGIDGEISVLFADGSEMLFEVDDDGLLVTY